MKKLIFTAFALTVPVFSSFNLVSCVNKKHYWKLIENNYGVFSIKEINTIVPKMKNNILFHTGKLSDIKAKKYDENKYLFTKLYKVKNKKTNEYIYGIMLIPISMFEKYKTFNEKLKNELLNIYSIRNLDKDEQKYRNISYYSWYGNLKEKMIHHSGKVYYYNKEEKTILGFKFSFDLYFNKEKSSVFTIKWYYGENTETKILLEYEPS